MMHSVRILGVAILFAAFTIPLSAQRLVTQAIDSGAVVRLRLLSGQWASGRLLSPFGTDSVVFRYTPRESPLLDDPIVQETRAADVSRVDIQRGDRALSGFLIGTGVCFVPAVLLAALQEGLDDSPESAFGQHLVINVGIGMAVCGGFGALIGARTPIWAPAP